MSNPRQGSRSSGSPRRKSGSKHEKKHPVPGFDPENYLKLKEAPLEVWIAEFLRRNREFRDDCEKAWRYPPAELTLEEKLDKYGVFVNNWHLDKPGDLPTVEVTLFPPVRGLRIEDYDSPRFEKIREKHSNADGLDALTLYNTMSQERSAEDVLSYLLKLISMDRPHNNGAAKRIVADDMLLLAVDLRCPREEIDHWIGKFVDAHIHFPKRTHPKKWLGYLMVFDLKEFRRLSDDEIGEVMESVLPEKKHRDGDSFYLETQNIRDSYRTAKELIEGNYRKYLHYFHK